MRCINTTAPARVVYCVLHYRNGTREGQNCLSLADTKMWQ